MCAWIIKEVAFELTSVKYAVVSVKTQDASVLTLGLDLVLSFVYVELPSPVEVKVLMSSPFDVVPTRNWVLPDVDVVVKLVNSM